jgi:probable O-glycosylation ligase (exosortase A-associated)
MLAIGAMGAYILMDRREPPRVTAMTVLLVLFTLWVTATTFWAVLPTDAWIALISAVKVLLFAVFIPYVIRSRIQIEAFLLVYIFSMAATFIAYGAKTLVSGGSYGINLGISDAVYVKNGEILCGICMMAVALILFVMKHGRIFPQRYFVKLGYLGLIVLAVATVIGTHARTGLVVMIVFAAVRWFIGRRKISWLVVYAAAAVTIFTFAPESWTQRMATIVGGAPAASEQARGTLNVSRDGSGEGTEFEQSAAVRLIMWQWTLDYVMQNPFGGGFDLYKVSRAGNERVLQRRAYHSSYFQVLGEHGWIGLGLFLTMLGTSLIYLLQAKRAAKRRPELAWIGDLSVALITALLCIMAAGAFTDMAFHPPYYYIFSLSVCVREYIRRVQQQPYAAEPKLAGPALPLPGRLAAGTRV